MSGPSSSGDKGQGVRALVLAPTRELAQQIHNECLKISQGRKWRITLFSKATAATLADKAVRDKIGIIFLDQVLVNILTTTRYYYQYTDAACVISPGKQTGVEQVSTV